MYVCDDDLDDDDDDDAIISFVGLPEEDIQLGAMHLGSRMICYIYI